jgi:hypothetical protein
MGRCAGAGEGGEGEQAGQKAGRPAHRGCWREGRWGRSRHDLAGDGRQARILESPPFKGVGGRGAQRRGLEEAWAGTLVGVESQGLQIDCL